MIIPIYCFIVLSNHFIQKLLVGYSPFYFFSFLEEARNYKEILAEGKPVVVDFWAPWCGPCKMVAPIIEELAAEFEGQVIIGKCDVDENSDLPAEYGIRNIPTVLFFKNGEIVDKQVGAVGKPVFVEKVKKLL